MLKKTAAILAITIGSLVSGCAGPPTDYVEADLATYRAIAPEYREYVSEDESLNENQKELRFITLDMWLFRIESALGEDVEEGGVE